jgi:hypothetical protein
MTAWLPMLLSGVLSLAPGPDAPDRSSSVGLSEALLNGRTVRVRTTDPDLKKVLALGVQRSPTFASLVAAVNMTDVIVYVERVSRLSTSISGRLMLVPVVHDQRYLRIQVRPGLTPEELIALIGHELRHALEVAADPMVRDQNALIKLYEHIGENGLGNHSYDTRAAQDTGYKVRGELTGPTL